MRGRTCLLALILAGCAPHPQLVMMNPRTGVTVGCPEPEVLAGSGAFLASRACFSACRAHGFRPVPGALGQSYDDGTPASCLN